MGDRMRIIAGVHKGLRLKAVPGSGTRPTTDKVKEALFSMIGPFFSGGKALDLYAGSGGLGIEALSRGMETCVFIDSAKQAIETIHTNLSHTKLIEQAEVYRNDASRALQALAKRDIQFSIVFLDPPYAKQSLEKLLSSIAEYNLLADEGIVVCEHDRAVSLRKCVGTLVCHREALYGQTVISLYRKEKKDDTCDLRREF